MLKNKNLRLLFLAALLIGIVFSQVNIASAQQEPPVGVVVAYTPGQSIIIADQNGTQHEYLVSSTLKILPPGRASSLAVGSFVTIIAPASIDQGKQTAVGIVIHPQVPGGWRIPAVSTTPLVTDTVVSTFTETVTPPAMETATVTVTGTQTAIDTATPTVLEATTETVTATATSQEGSTTVSSNDFMDWLASLFRQLLSRQ